MVAQHRRTAGVADRESRPMPNLDEEAAPSRAREHALHLLFFTDSATGRGSLLYQRYDGNLGLISPARRG
ncbi:Sigma 54 modulation/S30EA ribosomal protein C-terminal domain-containing protein [Mycobacterium basiliense]